MVHGPGVVTGRYGSVGAVVFVADSFWPLNTALYVREFHGNSRRFVFWLLTSMSTMMTESEGSKAAVPGVDRNDLHEIMVPVPTHNEQEVIARYLDRETAKIDALVAKNRGRHRPPQGTPRCPHLRRGDRQDRRPGGLNTALKIELCIFDFQGSVGP